MGDNQAKAAPEAVSEQEPSKNANEPVKVETPVEAEHKVSTAENLPEAVDSEPQNIKNGPATVKETGPAAPKENGPATPKDNGPATPANIGDDLSHLTPAIVEALSFDSTNKLEQELRVHNVKLQGLLGRVIELLKEKSSLCTNLEKQNNALMIQTNSLKDVVAITKDLLSIRNMEVEHLHVDIKSMEEKINCERERHNNMINRMSEAVKLNEHLKAEYQSQLQLFTDLRASYEKKVALLEGENKRLLSQISGSPPAPTPAGTGEGDVQLTLEAIPPP